MYHRMPFRRTRRAEMRWRWFWWRAVFSSNSKWVGGWVGGQCCALQHGAVHVQCCAVPVLCCVVQCCSVLCSAVLSCSAVQCVMGHCRAGQGRTGQDSISADGDEQLLLLRPTCCHPLHHHGPRGCYCTCTIGFGSRHCVSTRTCLSVYWGGLYVCVFACGFVCVCVCV